MRKKCSRKLEDEPHTFDEGQNYFWNRQLYKNRKKVNDVITVLNLLFSSFTFC
jgi:hypothetical protein